MKKSNLSSEEWLIHEDIRCHKDRLSRLDWLISNMPDANYLTFPGSLISNYLFEETRYCFVYGQFLAVIVLGLSYIEHTLAALFYMAGRDDLERATISTLLREAKNEGLITENEFDNLERARKARNPVTHFRRPSHVETFEYRAVTKNELPYTVIEVDAQNVMATVFSLHSKNAL